MKMLYLASAILTLFTSSHAAAVVNYTENNDLPGSSGFGPGSVSVGVFNAGVNTVTGSLSGNCAGPGGRAGQFDCNGPSAGDTQDSFLINIANGFRLASVIVTNSPQAGSVSNVNYAINLRNMAGFSKTYNNLVPASAYFDAYDVGPGVYSFSVYGGNAETIGTYALRYNLSFLVSSIPEPTTWAMMIGGFALIGGAMRVRRQRVAMAV